MDDPDHTGIYSPASDHDHQCLSAPLLVLRPPTRALQASLSWDSRSNHPYDRLMCLAASRHEWLSLFGIIQLPFLDTPCSPKTDVSALSLVGVFVAAFFSEWGGAFFSEWGGGVLTPRPTLLLYPGLRQAARSKRPNRWSFKLQIHSY
jgi:hypothetical protein